MVALGLV
jgi:hypothetical protein